MPASKKEAKEFVKRWKKRLSAIPAGSNNEQQDTQKFWVDLLINVLGIPSNTIDSFVDFERKVRGRRIDVFVSDHNFLCEQKSWGIDLDKPEPRNGGMETPPQQAMWYARHLPYSERPRWVMTCNFGTFRLYDLDNERPEDTVQEFSLEELPDSLYLLSFLTSNETSRLHKEQQLSIEAGSYVSRLYDALAKQYHHIEEKDERAQEEQRSLNVLITRIIFLLYAEDADLLRNQSKEQKTELLEVFDGAKNAGNIDYCGAWYMKAARFTQGKRTRCALVSTNSICQGEQVANLWKPLHDMGIHIDFAHNTFRWDNEAADKAHVFCVIVGFSREAGNKTLFYHATPDSDEDRIAVPRLNAYLKNAPDAFIWNRSKPLSDVPAIGIGSQPIDGGNYLFTPEEKAAFLSKEPAAEKYFHKWLGSQEFIRGIERWCLWLGEASWADLKGLPCCRERIENVRNYRLSSSRKQTLKAAERPNHFGTEIIPNSTAIIVPKVSSERRRYIPMGFVGSETLCSDLVFLIPNATLYHFGVLQSQLHNAWMRTVAGRLKSDYRYSGGIVYNNFVWPEPSEEQRNEVERCAQAVLDARDVQEGATLADMYDPKNETFFPELISAHKALDAAVEAAYGVDFGGDEEKIVAHLFNLYAEKVGEL